ncbi:hypothetical protein BESB_006860 [Besnoitia besnoiti]|uniref:Transmembrane protein n=1 Tax=Besnoitia besnoiti TaxID=94643 RepID=A0A2A9MK48_BESBE|nr:hypothetical protein BESB_006860 [Besnoitia besnoiti]PFH38345.1 hypothetical protein BESB_006860 [Besnoitia besnoiti]
MDSTAPYYRDRGGGQAPKPRHPASSPSLHSTKAVRDGPPRVLLSASTSLRRNDQALLAQEESGHCGELSRFFTSSSSAPGPPFPPSLYDNSYLNSLYRPPLLDAHGAVIPPAALGGLPPSPPSLPPPGEISMAALGTSKTRSEARREDEPNFRHYCPSVTDASSPYHVKPPVLPFSPLSIDDSQRLRLSAARETSFAASSISGSPRRPPRPSFFSLGQEELSSPPCDFYSSAHGNWSASDPALSGLSSCLASLASRAQALFSALRHWVEGRSEARRCRAPRVCVLFKFAAAACCAVALLLLLFVCLHSTRIQSQRSKTLSLARHSRNHADAETPAWHSPRFPQLYPPNAAGKDEEEEVESNFLPGADEEEDEGEDASEEANPLLAAAGTMLVIPGVGEKGRNACKESEYIGHTLRLAHEKSFFSLFSETKGMTKYEASDVVGTDDALYTVFDSSYAIGHTSYTLHPFEENNYLIGSPERPGGGDSQWEGLAYDDVTKHFFAVREAIVDDTNTPHAGGRRAPGVAPHVSADNKQADEASGVFQLSSLFAPSSTAAESKEEDPARSKKPSRNKKERERAERTGDTDRRERTEQTRVEAADRQTGDGGKEAAVKEVKAKKEKTKDDAPRTRGNQLPHYHAWIEELAVKNKTYAVLQSCRTEFRFSAENKGFEGLVGLRHANGSFYLLGLCEGNYCKGGKKGRKRGHGRLVLMEKVDGGDDGEACLWKTVKVLHLPPEIGFRDYSSIAVRGHHVAITSQEDSVVWIGTFNLPEDIPAHGMEGTGEGADKHKPRMLLTDPSALEVSPGGELLYFPRDEQCRILYCNIEGIAFTGRLLAAGERRWKSAANEIQPRTQVADSRVFGDAPKSLGSLERRR